MSNPAAKHAECAQQAWYRQPILWLGFVVFAASLAGCIWMIVLGSQHADQPLPNAGAALMKMQLERPADPPEPASDPP